MAAIDNTVVNQNFTLLNPGAAIPSYRFEQTAFVCHEIYSVADAIAANGVLAFDCTSQAWAWVAGEDLFLEVYRRGGTNLNTLARNLLNTKYNIVRNRIGLASYFSPAFAGSMNVGGILLPGLKRTTVSVGSDVRIFGVVTNMQAGRGVCADLIGDDVEYGQSLLTGCTMTADVESLGIAVPDASKLNPYAIGGAGYNCGATSACANGRAIIAIPVGTWDKFLTEWRRSIPHIDKSEVAARADAAISTFESVFKSHMFDVPSVRVPVVLIGSKAYIDTNPPRSHIGYTNNRGVSSFWHELMSPTLPDPTGWWITNPLTGGLGAPNPCDNDCVAGIGGNLFDAGAIHVANKITDYQVPFVPLTSIDGVDLLKILGGFYPQVDDEELSVSSKSLINQCFSGSHGDQPLPTQGGAETQTDYEGRLTQSSKAPYGALTANYGHWNLCGQPAVMGSILLDASLQGKSIGGHAAFTLFSGTLCSLLRCPPGNTSSSWSGADLVANPAPFLRNQYRA